MLMRSLSKNSFVLSTGKEFSANRLIIGINPDLDVFEGYDGDLQDWFIDDDFSAGPQFTYNERIEISLCMINLWRRWAKAGRC